MTTIINTFGGPGTGKSTSSSFIYYKLKSLGTNTEMVREYVKSWAWEGRTIQKYDQLYFTGKQVRAESSLFGKVDYIVTDSPVLLGAYYASIYATPSISRGVRQAILGYYEQAELDGHKHLHVYLKRTKPYVQAGRYEDFEQAKNIDAGVRNLLAEVNFPIIECSTDEADLASFVHNLVKKPSL